MSRHSRCNAGAEPVIFPLRRTGRCTQCSMWTKFADFCVTYAHNAHNALCGHHYMLTSNQKAESSNLSGGAFIFFLRCIPLPLSGMFHFPLSGMFSPILSGLFPLMLSGMFSLVCFTTGNFKWSQ